MPAAKIPNWNKDLQNAYITQINDAVVKSKQDILKDIIKCKSSGMKDVDIKFSTIEQQGIYPQHGVPQLYYNQMVVMVNHIFDIQHMNSQTTTEVEINNMDVPAEDFSILSSCSCSSSCMFSIMKFGISTISNYPVAGSLIVMQLK